MAQTSKWKFRFFPFFEESTLSPRARTYLRDFSSIYYYPGRAESPCHLLFRGTALSQSLLPLLHSSRIHHRHPLLLPFYRYSLFATSIQMKGVNSFWNRKGWLFVQTLRKLIQVKVDSSSSFNSDDISKNGIFSINIR